MGLGVPQRQPKLGVLLPRRKECNGQHLIGSSPGVQEQASMEQQLALMETGKVRTGEDPGVGWVDTTA